MPGKAAATLAGNYFGAAMKWGAKQPAVYMAAGGAALGGVAGSVWNYEAGGRAGAWNGFMAGAATGIAMSTGRGAWKLGRAGAARMASNAIPGAIGGGVAGAIFGPSDSTMANIGMGALAGAAGYAIGGRMGSHFANKYSHARMPVGKMGIRHAFAGTMPGGNVYGGVRLSSGRKFGGSLSTATIGGTASALFAPAAAHALVGRSRQDKSQNTFNRY